MRCITTSNDDVREKSSKGVSTCGDLRKVRELTSWFSINTRESSRKCASFALVVILVFTVPEPTPVPVPAPLPIPIPIPTPEPDPLLLVMPPRPAEETFLSGMNMHKGISARVTQAWTSDRGHACCATCTSNCFGQRSVRLLLDGKKKA